MITVSKLKIYTADLKVLYVEDDKDIQEEIHDFLSRFFPTLDLADNGQEGLELYKNGNYDIVISDINMPKMNGIEMVHAIKQINEDQKIIITSAYNEPQYLMDLIDSGIDKFVLKPFNHKKFLFVLYRICEEIYNKKLNQILEEKIAQEMVESQTILNMIEHGVIVIDRGILTMLNQQFSEISGYKNSESSAIEVKNVASLFEKHKGYIDVNSNEELIELLKSHVNELYKVVIKKKLENKVYILKYKKVENEDKFIISFTDITDEEELVNSDTKTGLPNIYAAIADIEERISSNQPFVIDVIRIENIEKMVKWHGRDIRNTVDKKVAQLFKKEKQTLDANGVFAAFYGHNKFILVRCDERMHGLVERIVNKISLITAVDENSIFEKTNILYKPIHLAIEIELNQNIDDIIKRVDENFEKILL